MTKSYGYMIQVPKCLVCGVTNAWMSTYAPKNRRPGAGIENVFEVDCACGAKMMYFISRSTWHGSDGLVIHESRSYYRRIWSRAS